MSRTLVAILGGAVGALALITIIVLLLWLCVFRNRSISRTSETGSSDPSIQVGRVVGIELSLQDARRFQMEELAMATKDFSDQNMIGVGKFGEVYKGLLQDGMLVAIKKRPGPPTQEFVNEERYLSTILHRNIAMMAPEYLPSLSSHRTLFVHSLPYLNGANLKRRVKEFGRFSDKGDVYSYGVFLLELITGREASELSLGSNSDYSLVEWMQNCIKLSDVSSIVDIRLRNNFTPEVMEEFVQLIIRCLDPSSGRRPPMSYVEMDLNRIYEKEVSLTIVMGEQTPTVILGSQLFRVSQ